MARGGSPNGAAGYHGHRGAGRVAHARGGVFGGRGHRGSGAYVSPVGFFPFDCT